MELYSGTSIQFFRDTTQNQIADKLRTAFFDHYRRRPSPGEFASWQNSLRAMCLTMQHAELRDHGVLLEYQVPLTSQRIDCVITGHDKAERPNATIVELKQWQHADVGEGDRVMTRFRSGQGETLHPSAQALQYMTYLQDMQTAFHEEPAVKLSSCAYLHNHHYEADDPLLNVKYKPYFDRVPLFSGDQLDGMTDFLQERLVNGNGMPVLDRVRGSKYRASRKLMEHAASVVKGNSAYTLLDDQVVAYDQIMAFIKHDLASGGKHSVIIRGGPGTGKSVVAINLLADAMKQGFTTNYATGSRAFTETLRKVCGTRMKPLFRYFFDYGLEAANSIDLLVCDEAHRIRITSANRYRKSTGMPQVDELLRAARVSVFLIDPHQMVRPDEIGSVEYIREAAKREGIPVREYDLQVQFRCAGSEGFVNWVNNTLEIDRTANVIWEGSEGFDFRIMSSPEDVEAAVRAKVAEGATGRVVAGFCWPWSQATADGHLKEDVAIGDYRRPWNARPDARGLAPGVPPSQLWAYQPGGIDQVGCIYTAQGFEFDYCGVIFGKDLRYDPIAGAWTGSPADSHDSALRGTGDSFTKLVKNTYRVLLSRGMKGCYVYFQDRDTEVFFRSRMRLRTPSA